MSSRSPSPRRPGRPGPRFWALGRGLVRVTESVPASVGLAIVLLWVLAAALAPVLSRYAPNANDFAAVADPTPSAAHWLGTDHLGRRHLARILWGARTVLVVGPLAVFGATILEPSWDCRPATSGGWVDLVVSRAGDIILTFPVIILYMIVLATFGSSAGNIIAVLTLTKAPIIARIVRGLTLEPREREYVAAAKMRASRPSTSCWPRSCRTPGAPSWSTCACASATPSSSSGCWGSWGSACLRRIPTGAAWSRTPTG